MTGVQTCALPICADTRNSPATSSRSGASSRTPRTLARKPGVGRLPGPALSVRGVRLLVSRLDDVASELRVSAHRQAGDARQALYAFAVHDESGALLVDGRATVILNALP